MGDAGQNAAERIEVDAYDFDRTLVPFDSGSRYMLYCFARYPYLWLFLPLYALAGLLFCMRVLSLSALKRRAFFFIRLIPLEKTVKGFWDRHEKKVFDWARPENRERNAVVISASPDFLLEEIAKRLKIYRLIATRHDRKTGVMLGNNCNGAEKARRFRAEFGENIVVKNAYTDNAKLDRPMLMLGENRYRVMRDGRREKAEV